MKRTAILSLVLTTSMLSFAQVPYNIQGVWKTGAGKKITLVEKLESQKLTLDSTVVASDGTFALKGNVDKVKGLSFGYDGRMDNIFLAGQPLITVEIGEKTEKKRSGEEVQVPTAKIDGGKEQQVFEEFTTMYMTKTICKLGFMLAMSQNREDSVKLDSINAAFTEMLNNIEVKLVQSLKDYNDVCATPYFINTTLLSDFSLDDLKGYYDGLTDQVKASEAGKDLKASLDRLGQVNVGGYAPDFTLKTPDGKDVSLSQFRGKVLLLDFWATWCGPCLREMPNVISIYKKYHSKGLEILGVSLDEEKSADRWRQMIKDRGMDWNHGSSLKGWDCPVAKMFNVTAIPRMYIIDKDGKIIAQDLRGEALADKMAEIFK